MTYETNYLVHHGIKGQKWGVRRFQNSDGTLTSAGQKRYSAKEVRDAKKEYKRLNKEYDKAANAAIKYDKNSGKSTAVSKAMWEHADSKYIDYANAKEDYDTKKSQSKSNSNLKTALKVGAVVAGATVATYGAYKASEFIKEQKNLKEAERFMQSLENNKSKGLDPHFVKSVNRTLELQNELAAQDRIRKGEKLKNRLKELDERREYEEVQATIKQLHPTKSFEDAERLREALRRKIALDERREYKEVQATIKQLYPVKTFEDSERLREALRRKIELEKRERRRKELWGE